MDIEAKYLSNFGGWLAFRHGKTVRTKDRRIRVFRTQEAAPTAARKSKMRYGTR